MKWFLLISVNEDGKILSSKDRRLQAHLDDGWSVVGVVAINSDNTINVVDFCRSFEMKYSSFSVAYFAQLTSVNVMKRWFLSRPSFSTFSAWLQSASNDRVVG